jgi:hypothetical protein
LTPDAERDIGKGASKPAGGDAKPEGNNDREVEREVAAALESVFPRIGLKAFVMLSPEQKRAQVRLFPSLKIMKTLHIILFFCFTMLLLSVVCFIPVSVV